MKEQITMTTVTKARLVKIKNMVDHLGSESSKVERSIERRERLQKMTEKYGYESVALAAGLTVGSLSMYLRSKHPSVSEKAVSQAEYVFRNV